MTIALRGNLEDFGIAEIFQLIGQQRKTGVLEIEHEGPKIQLFLDNGAVVHGETVGSNPDAALAERLLRCGEMTREQLRDCGYGNKASLQRLRSVILERGLLSLARLQAIEDLLTQDALFRLLRWTEGSFHFRAEPVSHEREPEQLLGAEQILMDGLRMVDEWRTFAAEVPNEDTVFQRVGRFETYPDRVEGEAQRRIPEAKRLFLLIDGRLSVRRTIDLARLGTFQGTQALADLRRAGLIEPLDPARVTQARERLDRARGRIEGPSLPWFRTLAPIAVLAGMALAIPFVLGQLHSASESNRFPIRRESGIEARSAFETERIRKALEAFRFSSGRWPDRLEELVSAGFLQDDALVSVSERPYYYVRREGNVLLLAPEHRLDVD